MNAVSKTFEMRKVEERLGEDIYDFIYRKYHDEKLTTIEIGEILGYASCTIGNWMKRLGIPARTQTEAAEIKYDKMPEEKRKSLTKKANDKVRKIIKDGEFWLDGAETGANNIAKRPEVRRKNSEYHKKHNAMFNEESAAKMRRSMEGYLRTRATTQELILKKALEKLGYYPKFQHAVCRAILDFAFVDLKIGIEIDGVTHMTMPSKREKDKRRDEELERDGWIILRFFNSEIEDELGECLREIIEVVEANKRLQKKVKEAI